MFACGGGRAVVQALNYLRHRGLARTIVKFVTMYVVGRQRWYVTRSDIAALLERPPLPAGDGLEFRAARPDDLPLIEAFPRQTAATYRSWLRPGYLLFLALHEGCPIAYRCLSTIPSPWVAGFFRLRPDQIYSVDVFTLPEYRRRRAAARLRIAMAPVLLGRGFREVLSIQRPDNAESNAYTDRTGIARIGVLTRTCIAGRVRFSFTPLSGPPGPRPPSTASKTDTRS